jgi:plasmid stabilization system protein ParE
VSRYILSPDADQDLNEIWDYIAADNVDAADRWIGRLFEAFKIPAEIPAELSPVESVPRMAAAIGEIGRGFESKDPVATGGVDAMKDPQEIGRRLEQPAKAGELAGRIGSAFNGME